MQVKFQKRHELAQIPKRATELAGGWDVVATEIIQESINSVVCKFGFSLQPPSNYKITLVPRSNITKTKWVMQNSPGLGDADYMGEYQIRFGCVPSGFSDYEYKNNLFTGRRNILKYEEFPYKVGDRIGQMYLEEVVPIEFIEVDELSSTERGEGGFGSTNK